MPGPTTTVRSYQSLLSAILEGDVCVPIKITRCPDGKLPMHSAGLFIATDQRIRLEFRDPNADIGDFFIESRSSPVPWVHAIIDSAITVRLNQLDLVHQTASSGCPPHLTFSVFSLEHWNRRLRKGMARTVAMEFRIPSTKLEHKNTSRRVTEKWDDQLTESDSAKLISLTGQITPYAYSFRQESSDVLLLVKLLDENHSTSASNDTRFARQLIRCFNWINGGTPFEITCSHSRDHSKHEIFRRPWSGENTRGRVAPPGRQEREVVEILGNMVPTLTRRNHLGKSLELLLWQYQQASGRVTLGSLLQMCSLLEGLVGALLRCKYHISRPAINKLPPPSGHGRRGTAECRFHELGRLAGFSWTTEMGPAYRSWKEVRNSLAHGNVLEIEKKHGVDIISHYHAVTQAFNALVLRAADFQGPVNLDGSPFAVGC